MTASTLTASGQDVIFFCPQHPSQTETDKWVELETVPVTLYWSSPSGGCLTASTLTASGQDVLSFCPRHPSGTETDKWIETETGTETVPVPSPSEGRLTASTLTARGQDVLTLCPQQRQRQTNKLSEKWIETIPVPLY